CLTCCKWRDRKSELEHSRRSPCGISVRQVDCKRAVPHRGHHGGKGVRDDAANRGSRRQVLELHSRITGGWVLVRGRTAPIMVGVGLTAARLAAAHYEFRC